MAFASQTRTEFYFQSGFHTTAPYFKIYWGEGTPVSALELQPRPPSPPPFHSVLSRQALEENEWPIRHCRVRYRVSPKNQKNN